MNNCKSCRNLFCRDICYFCHMTGSEIKNPYLMGGSKKCECYEKKPKGLTGFKYPEKER